jgi:hypothetical protein
VSRNLKIASSLFNTPFSQLPPNAQFALRLVVFIAVHLLKRLAHPAARVARRVLRDLSHASDTATLKDVIDDQLPKVDRELRLLAQYRHKLEYLRLALREWRTANEGLMS